jgi:hypothetical protein
MALYRDKIYRSLLNIADRFIDLLQAATVECEHKWRGDRNTIKKRGKRKKWRQELF